MGAHRLERLLGGVCAVFEGIGSFLLGGDSSLNGRGARLEFIGSRIYFVCARLQSAHDSL